MMHNAIPFLSHEKYDTYNACPHYYLGIVQQEITIIIIVSANFKTTNNFYNCIQQTMKV